MTDEEMTASTAQVECFLKEAKLPVTAEEKGWLIDHYLDIQAIKSELRLPEVRYGSPVLIYSASPRQPEGK